MDKRLLVKNQNKLLSELSPEIPSNGIITVGNDISATIELKDDFVAPEQFVIVCEPEQMTLMCRVDGTIINGETMPQGAIHNLQNGDVVRVGDYSFMLEGDEKHISESPSQPLPIQNPTPKNLESAELSENKNERTLTDILKGLRAEEKFYFQIEKANSESRQIYVEKEEMWLGWSAEGVCVLTADSSEIEAVRGQIRKDWSGVVIYPMQTGSVWLENNLLTEPHRLKNDERIFLQARDGGKSDLETVIKFHEPTALLVLDSILPKELPPPISLDEQEISADDADDEETDLDNSQIPSVTKPRQKRLLFGYFTITEVIIMIIGTLITAALIFLILEIY